MSTYPVATPAGHVRGPSPSDTAPSSAAVRAEIVHELQRLAQREQAAWAAFESSKQPRTTERRSTKRSPADAVSMQTIVTTQQRDGDPAWLRVMNDISKQRLAYLKLLATQNAIDVPDSAGPSPSPRTDDAEAEKISPERGSGSCAAQVRTVEAPRPPKSQHALRLEEIGHRRDARIRSSRAARSSPRPAASPPAYDRTSAGPPIRPLELHA